MSIVTNAECLALARQDSQLPAASMESYRIEALDIDIKPSVRDNLFIALTVYTDADSPEPNLLFETLLNGGTYVYNEVQYNFSGLKKAAAYFAYARMIKGIDLTPTAFGIRVKNASESDAPDYRQKIQFANDCISVGNAYLYDCVEYIKRMLPTYREINSYRRKRSKFKIIGD
jgi:hypothetical protein